MALKGDDGYMKRTFYILCLVACIIMPPSVTYADGFMNGASKHTILLAEVQSYGDYELKSEYFQTFADKLIAAISEKGEFKAIGRNLSNMTNEAGRHDETATPEDAMISKIHMDAIVHGHKFDYGFAAAKLIRYADKTVGRNHFYDDDAVKAWRSQPKVLYHLTPQVMEEARKISMKYGVEYLMFVNMKDVDVRLKHTMFASRTERETRGKKMKASLDYYIVNMQSGRVYEGHTDNKKTAQLLNLAIVQLGKGMDVDMMLNQVMDTQVNDVVNDLYEHALLVSR